MRILIVIVINDKKEVLPSLYFIDMYGYLSFHYTLYQTV